MASTSLFGPWTRPGLSKPSPPGPARTDLHSTPCWVKPTTTNTGGVAGLMFALLNYADGLAKNTGPVLDPPPEDLV